MDLQYQRTPDAFFSAPPREVLQTANSSGAETEKEKRGFEYSTLMIDEGFCFNAGEWNFPDAPLRGLYARNRVYEGVIGMESFAPWLERLEKQMIERALDDITRQIPPAWYEDDLDAVLRLSEQLLQRRSRVPELLLAAKQSNRQPFPNWV